ncbi:hypothetical protein IAT38_005302 [Cryptococcus sp. DSM 104549]
MFVLLGVRDTVPVAPKAFDIPPAVTIEDSLNKKFANKLVPDKGLALSVYDILTAEDGKVTWGNGLMYYKVSFRLLLFAPFHGELLVGRVMSITRSYIRISLGFFQDIYILQSLLPPNSVYDPDKKAFFYVTDDDKYLTPRELLESPLGERMYIYLHDVLRFRVDSIEWQDVRPTPQAQLKEAAAYEAAGAGGPPVQGRDPIEKAGFKILATIADVGLGIPEWWEGQGEVDDAPDGEEAQVGMEEDYQEYGEYDE